MNPCISNIQKALILWREGKEKFREAESALSHGPSDYYEEKITDYVNALFDRFAPFKVGNRIAISNAPQIKKGSGWDGSQHFLIKGEQGIIQSVDYYDNKFVADIVFDNESWIDSKGLKQPVSIKHTFRLNENEVARI